MDFAVEVILDIGSDEFYRADRYHTPICVLLINSKDKGIFDILEKSLRQTDMIQQLTSELIVVFLTHSKYDDAMLYINKIQSSTNLTYTIGEYSESKVDFVENLFMQNNKKIEEKYDKSIWNRSY